MMTGGGIRGDDSQNTGVWINGNGCEIWNTEVSDGIREERAVTFMATALPMRFGVTVLGVRALETPFRMTEYQGDPGQPNT
jgi:hypothetical protein